MTAKRAESFPDICRTALIEQTRASLDFLQHNVLWKDNLPARPCMALQAIYPLAYLYKTPFAGNTYRGHPELLKTVEQTGDFLAACVSPRRSDRFHTTAHSLLATLDWAILFWLDAYALVRNDLSATRTRRWQTALAVVLNEYQGKLRGFMDQQRFNSSSFRTSPNHAISYATDLLVGGIVLDQPRFAKLADHFAQRFAQSQTPAGYWTEGRGPVGGYQSVSLAGIARFNALRAKPIYRDALTRALDYHQTISYPDHSFVALIDKRQRYHPGPNIHGLFGFTHLPHGRSLAKAALLAALRQNQSANLSFWARLLENYVYFKRGPIPRYQPWHGQRMLENHSCFVRHNRWQYNLSVNPVVVDPNSPYRLDYHVLCSVWHQSVGLIVPGSQDKNRPWHNTFYARRGAALGVLHGGRIGNLCQPKYLEAFYASGLTGRIDVAVSSADVLELTAKLQRSPRRPHICFNLPLAVGIGQTLHVARTAHVLTRKKVALTIRPGAEVMLFSRKVRVTSQTGGRLHFPCLPFNSYSKANRSTLSQAFLRFEIPVPPDGAPTRIRIKVQP